MVQSSLTKVEIYTDGACSGNPGPGGWAAILCAAEHELEVKGAESPTTNQRMELRAAIEGLKALRKPCEVTLYSDSAYLVNGLTQKWYVKWRQSGWVNAKKEPVKNRDLWEELILLSETHTVHYEKVKGHSGHHYNERCDELARMAIKELGR